MVSKNVLSCLLKDGKEFNAGMLVGRPCRPEARIQRWVREKIWWISNLLKTFDVRTLSNSNAYFVTSLNMSQIWTLTFHRWCSNILGVWWDILCGFCLQFTPFSNGERILKMVKFWQSYHHQLVVQLFLEHSVHVVDWVWLFCLVDKLLSLHTLSDTDFAFTKQQMHDIAKLTADDILYEFWTLVVVKCLVPKRKLQFPGHSNKLGEWVNEYTILLHGLTQQWRPQRKWNLAQS